MRALVLLCGFALLLTASSPTGVDVDKARAAVAVAGRGPLVAVGGGSTVRKIRLRMLELARAVGLGDQPRVLVVPQASSRANAGVSSVEMWREHGLHHVALLTMNDREQALEQIAGADIIWMPGGSQNRLMRALREARLIEAIRQRHAEGAMVGGTSAGAAVLSGPMITGEADLESIRRGTTELHEGLGLWPNAIVDQHFVARRRFNRLLSAVLDAPGQVGIGVDESTAAILHRDGTIEVVGDASVVFIDARAADVADEDDADHHAASNITVHVLTDGMRRMMK